MSPLKLALPMLGPLVFGAGLVAASPGAHGDQIGESVALSAGDRRFTALYRSSQRALVRGAVLLLHAPGGQADAVDVIRPLRLGLAEAGWETLALQLPPRLSGETATGWLARHQSLGPWIEAGLSWLRQRNQRSLAVLAEGASGGAAWEFLGRNTSAEVEALILISAPAFPVQDVAGGSVGSSLLVLDVLAERDWPEVIDAVRVRQEGDVRRPGFSQRTVIGAIPGFPRTGDSLVAAVRAWLAANVDRPSQ